MCQFHFEHRWLVVSCRETISHQIHIKDVHTVGGLVLLIRSSYTNRPPYTTMRDLRNFEKDFPMAVKFWGIGFELHPEAVKHPS